MTSLLRGAAGWVFVGCASSAACALVGYDFDGYSPSGAGGSGGSDATSSQGPGSSASAGSSNGPAHPLRHRRLLPPVAPAPAIVFFGHFTEETP
jgi:hypothetical protein